MYDIEIENINFSYGKKKILNDINLNIKKGSFFGLLGVNGAGKSTLLNIISTILKPSIGNVKISGFSTATHANSAKKSLGVVPQEINLNGFETVRNSILTQAGFFGIQKKDITVKCDYLIEKLKLTDKANSQIISLSGGMKRRVMIARSLINSPSVLLLDEPTAGVDVEIRRDMWKFIRQLNKEGMTIILTTHYLEEAESLCNEIAVINDGKIKLQKTKSELFEQINTQNFIFELNSPIDKKNEVEIIKNINTSSNIAIKIINSTELEISIGNGYFINDAISILDKEKLMIKSVKHSKNRLESVLLNS